MTISIEEAQNLLLNAISKKPKEEELLLENALGRILSRDIISQMQVPPFYRSSMDGYALLSSATVSSSEENPRSFQVLQEIGAGSMADYPIDEKTTIKIMTGAAIPENADCVIRFEDIIRQGQEIILKMPVKKGQNIIPAGEDIAQNQKTASQGDILSPPLLGILASLGQKSVYVYQKPQIAIISTGSELWDIGQP
ncbi:MAG: molybdopterin molybdenumtransferase MoeA, partial [Clostridiales bacterium]